MTITVSKIRKALAATTAKFELTGKGQSWTCELADDESNAIFDALFPGHGGFCTGYGSWVRRPGYTPSSTEGDYCTQTVASAIEQDEPKAVAS